MTSSIANPRSEPTPELRPWQLSRITTGGRYDNPAPLCSTTGLQRASSQKPFLSDTRLQGRFVVAVQRDPSQNLATSSELRLILVPRSRINTQASWRPVYCQGDA